MKIRAAVLEQFGRALEARARARRAGGARGARPARRLRRLPHRPLHGVYLAGDLDVDAFVSHKLTLDDVNRGFELMEAQDGIRSVIDFS